MSAPGLNALPNTATHPAAVPATPPVSLAVKARGGLAWATASVVLTLVLQLGFGAVMARLLDPATFGLVAMAMVALRLFSYLSQIGLSMTLGAMQRQAMTEDDLRVSLGVVWAASALSISATWLLAPLAAGFFNKSELVLLLRVLAFSLLLQALAHVSTSLLRRHLRFRALALVETLAYGLGYGFLGVWAALSGWGAWSLVVATFGQAVLSLVLAYACTRHALVPRWRGAGDGHWRYGARHTVISFSEFLSANMDSALIGRLIGDTALGLYNRAHVLVYQPMERAAGIFTRVLFPVVAVIQHERAKVGSLFVLGIGVIGVLAGVISLSLSAAAADVVALLLGPRWADAVPVVQLLALAVPVILMSNIAGVLCDAMDLLRFKLKLQLCGMTLVLALMLGLSGHGVLGIVAGLVIGESLRCAAYVYFLSTHLAYRRADALRVLAVVGLAAAAAALAVHGTMNLGHAQGWPLPLRLLLEAAAGAVLLALGLLGLVRVLQPLLAGEVARAHVPGWSQVESRLSRALP